MSNRSEEEPRTSPTKLIRRSRSSEGVGTRPPARSRFELVGEAVEASRIVEQSGDVRTGTTGHRSEQRPERGGEIAQKGREGPVGIRERLINFVGEVLGSS